MENENNENLDSPNEEEVVTEADDHSGDEGEETVESLKEKNAKLFARAKKAEGFELVDGKWVKKQKSAPAQSTDTKPKTSKEADLSPKDVMALMKAEVPEEDIEEVQKASKVLGVSIAEAIKDPVTKAVLERRAALRKTAQATNTSTARPSAKKVSGDELNKGLAKGEVPDKGSSDAEELFWARRGGRRK
ncbi:MAG: hypothetical protein KGL39_37900 [Patescibacteria group bacterium]|nr:hypothetical protein [Patescibacteria group bacterium]